MLSRFRSQILLEAKSGKEKVIEGHLYDMNADSLNVEKLCSTDHCNTQ